MKNGLAENENYPDQFHETSPNINHIKIHIIHNIITYINHIEICNSLHFNFTSFKRKTNWISIFLYFSANFWAENYSKFKSLKKIFSKLDFSVLSRQILGGKLLEIWITLKRVFHTFKFSILSRLIENG